VPDDGVGDALGARREALPEEVGERRRERRPLVGERRAGDGGAVALGSGGADALAGEELQEDDAERPDVVGASERLAGQGLRRKVGDEVGVAPWRLWLDARPARLA